MDRGLDFLFEGNLKSLVNSKNNPGISESGAFGWAIPQDPSGSHVASKFQPGKLINYRGRQFNHGDFNLYGVELTGLGENVQPNDQSETDVTKLIDWSQRYPSIKLHARDFAYCKDLEKYPNNRLAVLRRFAGPVGNNLFIPQREEVGYPPIATVVSWIPPEEEKFFNVSFNEKWVQQSEDIFDIVKFKMGKITSMAGNNMVANSWGKQVIYNILEQMGVTGLSFEDFFGSPDIIKTTHRRQTDGDGFDFQFNHTLTARYEMRHLNVRGSTGLMNQVDSQVAMYDILSNLIRMGTSDSKFRLDTGFGMFSSNILDAMVAGKTSQILEQLLKGATSAITSMLKTLANKVSGTFNELKNAASGENATKDLANVALEKLKGVLDATLKGIFAEHRVMMQSAIAGASGLPNAPWHLSLGNPKKPVMSIGDLVCEKVEISGSNRLGYDDWPTELEAKITLKNARPLGAQEIENIFNAAQGRIHYRQIVKFPKSGTKIIINNSDDEIKKLKESITERDKKIDEFSTPKKNNSTGQVNEKTKNEGENTKPNNTGGNNSDSQDVTANINEENSDNTST